jgi:alpha-1,2-mannosyltransferase
LSRAAPALAAAAAWTLFLGLAFSLWKQLPAVYPLDGEVDWALARAFLAGDNPYTAEGMARYHLAQWGGVGHPPTTGLWFLPFAGLRLTRLNQALGACMLALLGAHLVLVCRALRFPFAAAWAGLLAALVVRQEWFVHHLAIAQISELIAFLLVLAWLALRQGRDLAAGAAVGLACTLKLFPGALALFLLVTGRRRAFVAAAGAYLAVAALATARFGPSSWPLFFAQQPPIAARWVGQSYNASLEGILLRLAHPGAAPAPLEGWVPVVYPFLAAALLGAALWAVHRRGRAPALLDLSFALVGCVGAFVNPWVWPHYHALLILPALLVAAGLVAGWRRGASGPALIAVAGLLLIMLLVPAASWPASIAAISLLIVAAAPDPHSSSLPKKLTSLPR